jgi:hypothetical protein
VEDQLGLHRPSSGLRKRDHCHRRVRLVIRERLPPRIAVQVEDGQLVVRETLHGFECFQLRLSIARASEAIARISMMQSVSCARNFGLPP